MHSTDPTTTAPQQRNLTHGPPGGRDIALSRKYLITGAAVALLATTTAAHAVTTPQQRCLEGLAKAAAKYAKCIQTQVSKAYKGSTNYQAGLGNCVTKYAGRYVVLNANALTLAPSTVETCDQPRFVSDPDTVVDNLTGLQWEKKTDPAGIHQKDNTHDWSATGTAADGEVFTNFLLPLNTAGFAGQNDWRLPTLAELLTITEPAYPRCTAPPCINEMIFGPTSINNHWTSTTYLPDPTNAWIVPFGSGLATFDTKAPNGRRVRAVRGGF